MQWIKKQLRYIFLAFYLLTNGVIVTEASLSGGPSGSRSSLVSLFLSIFINQTLPTVDPEEVLVEAITVRTPEGNAMTTESTYFIPIGITRRFSVEFYPEDTTDKGITWTTSDPDVLEVYPGGFLEARSFGSNVVVTAIPSNPAKKQSFLITVRDRFAPHTFTAALAKDTISVGTTTTLEVSLSPQDAREYDPYKLHYVSADETVAIVNEYGVVKGVGVGTTTISVDGFPETYEINVTPEVVPLIMAESITPIISNFGYVYDKTPIDFTFDKLNVTDPSVTITSSNNAVATIIKEDDNYFVYGTKVAGTATITIYYNSDFLVKTTHDITLQNVVPITLNLSANKSETNVGTTITLTPTLTHGLIGKDDVPVTDQRVTYTSSDPSIATVTPDNLNARVVGKKVGTVTITATSVANPLVSASFELKITPTPFINDNNFGEFQTFIRKAIGHFMLFFVSALFGFGTFYLFLKDDKREDDEKKNEEAKEKQLIRTVIYSLIVGIFFAILSEVIQLFVPGRTGSVIDVLIDSAGYITATFLLFLICYLKKRAAVKRAALPTDIEV